MPTRLPTTCAGNRKEHLAKCVCTVCMPWNESRILDLGSVLAVSAVTEVVAGAKCQPGIAAPACAAGIMSTAARYTTADIVAPECSSTYARTAVANARLANMVDPKHMTAAATVARLGRVAGAVLAPVR